MTLNIEWTNHYSENFTEEEINNFIQKVDRIRKIVSPKDDYIFYISRAMDDLFDPYSDFYRIHHLKYMPPEIKDELKTKLLRAYCDAKTGLGKQYY